MIQAIFLKPPSASAYQYTILIPRSPWVYQPIYMSPSIPAPSYDPSVYQTPWAPEYQPSGAPVYQSPGAPVHQSLWPLVYQPLYKWTSVYQAHDPRYTSPHDPPYTLSGRIEMVVASYAECCGFDSQQRLHRLVLCKWRSGVLPCKWWNGQKIGSTVSDTIGR